MSAWSKDKPPKILIVDDEPINLRILGNILQQKGLDVGFASSAAQALASLQYRIPDLFLLDIMMPEVDGYELALQLRSLPTTENIPIIFISALDDTDSKVKGFEAGGADYISKPFNPREVALADVYDALRSRRVYKEPYSAEETERIIQDSAGTHFDPALIQIFMRLRRNFASITDTYRDPEGACKG